MPAAHYVGDSCPGGHQSEYEEMFLPWGGQSPVPVKKPEVMLESVSFLDGGIGIAYMTSEDRKMDGSLIATHTLAIQETPNTAALIAAVRTSVLALLEDSLEDFRSASADVPVEESDEDDDD